MPVSGKTGKRHSKSCNRSYVTAQKVVIPKGMINPNETTIIEIPCRLHKQPVVVAKPNDIPAFSLSADENPDMHSSISRSPRNLYDNYNCFYSAGMQQEGQCGYASSSSIEKNIVLKADTNLHLDETEEQERLQLQKDLQEFQKARRKLVASTSQFAAPLNSNGGYGAGTSMCNSNNPSGLPPCSASTGYGLKRENRMIDPRFDQEEYARQLYNML